MKKKMTVICALLALVGITSYSVSGTYAKYVAEASYSDTARVAKWGFKNKTVAIDLFAKSYTTTLAGQDNAIDVNSSNDEKVVAPGTSGIYIFKFDDNMPETNYELTVSDNSSLDEITTKGNGQMKYYIKEVAAGGPVPATFNDAGFNKTAASTEKFNTLSDLVTGLGSLLNGVYGANSAPNKTYVIGWEWEFDGNDSEDTNLGNGIAKGATEAGAQAKVELKVKIDVVQSEKKPTK